ncbi:MAG TPA: hypothetical protein VF258_10280 [Luteolibacter sp.]
MIKRTGKNLEEFFRRMRPHFSPSHRRAFGRMIGRGLSDYQEGEPIVVFDLADSAVDAVGGRYYSGMVRDFVETGYFPVFMAHLATVSSFVMKGKKSFLLDNRFGVVRSFDELKVPFFLITDRQVPAPALATKVVKMVYQHRLCESEEDMEMPFFVHPYVGAKIKLPHPYRIEDLRMARIFFGGNTTEDRYSKDSIKKNYRILTRREVLAVATETAGDGIYRPADAIEWLASTEAHPFVMFETQKGGIPRDRWVDALANSDFFLACPGVDMPLCHNLIEAMAGGAIPILQYAAYLPVPLENRVNALTFDNADSLHEAVKAALGMSAEEVVQMRANVSAYYQKFLAPGCFARRLFDGNATRKNLLFNAYRVPR